MHENDREITELFTEIVLKNRQLIYVCGYPRSGTTWLTRLLAECLDSPALSWSVKNDVWRPDKRDHAVEGLWRRGPYAVRHGHFKAREFDLDKDRVVVIHRDPRDVAVSVFHYFRFHGGFHKTVVGQMCGEKGKGLAFCNVGGRGWGGYTRAWLNSHAVQIRYETLVQDTESVITGVIVKIADKMPPQKQIQDAVRRHTFNNRQKDKTMRKGKTGEWKNELPTALARKMETLNAAEMRALGYL